jgi:cytochrome c-type biogenesis protein CcmH/NrfG
MPRVGRRTRHLLLVIILATVLTGAGFAARWGKSRLFPEFAEQASAAVARGDWAKLALLCRERLKRVPQDPAALRLAARAAARQDRDSSAIAIYSKLFLEDMDAEDLFLLGRSLRRTGKADLAGKTFERALLANPDHPETLDALAQLYLENDRDNAAERAGERLARQAGWEARGLLILGAARAELHDHAGAAQVLERFFQVDPEGRAAAPSPVRPFRLLLARSLLKTRRPALARQLLANLLAQGPDAEASWLLGRAYIQEHDWDRAASLLAAGAPFRDLNPLEGEPAPYIGAARCAACHAEIYRSLLASTHATTFSRAADLDKLALPSHPVPDPGNSQVTHDFKRRGSSLQVETRLGDEIQRAVVTYAFGSRDHFMTFVGRDHQGRSRMIRMSHYESTRGSGWDLATGLPKRPDDPHQYLGTTLLEGDGVRRCLFCHTTNFRAVLDQSGPEAADPAIGCEKCHGPGAHHVAAANAGFDDPAIVNPGRLPAPLLNKTCGQCHDLHDDSVISAPRTDPVWYRFQSLALTWSRCYTESEGNLSCTTCHDPHAHGRSSPARNEAKCLSCHGPDRAPASAGLTPYSSSAAQPNSAQPKTSPTARRTTCPVDPAKGCIECHMPSAYYPATHSIKTDHFIRVRDRLASEK